MDGSHMEAWRPLLVSARMSATRVNSSYSFFGLTYITAA